MIILGLVVGICFLVIAWMLNHAPEGWEDDEGFHRGK